MLLDAYGIPLNPPDERVRPSQLTDADKYGDVGGVVERYSWDNEDDALIVTRIQDCTPFLERNHFIREHTEDWRGDDNDMWKIASIPNMVIEAWMKRGINIFDENDWPKVRALLNGEYAYLKTAPKVI